MKSLGFGIVEYEGKEYALTEEAYYESGYGKGFSEFYTDAESGKIEFFTALAMDENGTLYRVFWKISKPDAELAEDMCDWDTIAAVEIEE